MEKKAIELGQKYRDKVHGFEGFAMAHTRFYTGCDRVMLQKMNDGKITDWWFDITQIEGIEIDTADQKPGGPGAIPDSKDYA